MQITWGLLEDYLQITYGLVFAMHMPIAGVVFLAIVNKFLFYKLWTLIAAAKYIFT